MPYSSHLISGRYKSCEVQTCFPGFQAEPCFDGSKTKCVPCPSRTYQNRSTISSENRQCKNMRVCSGKSGMEKVGGSNTDPSKDQRCRCMTQFGYQDINYDRTDPYKSPEECLYCTKKQYVNNGRCTGCPREIGSYENGHRYCHIPGEPSKAPSSVIPATEETMQVVNSSLHPKQIAVLNPNTTRDIMNGSASHSNVSVSTGSGDSAVTAHIVLGCVSTILVIAVIILLVYMLYNKLCKGNSNGYHVSSDSSTSSKEDASASTSTTSMSEPNEQPASDAQHELDALLQGRNEQPTGFVGLSGESQDGIWPANYSGKL